MTPPPRPEAKQQEEPSRSILEEIEHSICQESLSGGDDGDKSDSNGGPRRRQIQAELDEAANPERQGRPRENPAGQATPKHRQGPLKVFRKLSWNEKERMDSHNAIKNLKPDELEAKVEEGKKFLLELREIAPKKWEVAQFCLPQARDPTYVDGNIICAANQCPIYGCETRTKYYAKSREHFAGHRKILIDTGAWKDEGYDEEALKVSKRGITAKNIEEVPAFSAQVCKRAFRGPDEKEDKPYETSEQFTDRVWRNNSHVRQYAKALWLDRWDIKNREEEWLESLNLTRCDYLTIGSYLKVKEMLYDSDGNLYTKENVETKMKSDRAARENYSKKDKEHRKREEERIRRRGRQN